MITLADLKAHLNIIDDEADDTLLAGKIAAAQAHVENFTGPLGEDVPAPLKEAVRQLAAHLYENREASIIDGTVRPIPLGFHDLIAPYRAWEF